MEIALEDLKPYLDSLSNQQKEKLLYQLLKKDKALMQQLYFKHVGKVDQLDERYSMYEEHVQEALTAHYRARVNELAMAKAIGVAKKAINEFTKIDKRPEKEANLLMVILDHVFDISQNPAAFGTCFTKYDFAVTQTLKRFISVVKNKLHEDFLMDYKERVDHYLSNLKNAANFNDFVYALPDEL